MKRKAPRGSVALKRYWATVKRARKVYGLTYRESRAWWHEFKYTSPVEPTARAVTRYPNEAYEAVVAVRGTETEVTATTRGGTPKTHTRGGGRVVDDRQLMVKIRVHHPKGWSETEVKRTLAGIVQTGRVPTGVEVRYVDWGKGLEGVYASDAERRAGGTDVGHYTGAATLDALQNFWAAIEHAQTDVRLGNPGA